MSGRRPQGPMPGHAGHPLLAQAVALHQSGRTDEAAEMYRRIIAQIPRHFDATHLLGVIALQEGRLDQADQLIASALEINPKDAAALCNLGTVNLRKGRLEAALRNFERSVKLQPGSPNALSNLGSVLRQLGRVGEALEPLQRAHAADPTSATVCNLLGACFLDTGDTSQALKYFEAATQADPDHADGWANLAVVLNIMGEHGRARECADKAVVLQPQSSSALAALAAVQFEQGHVEAAIATFQDAVALPDPTARTLCAYANALLTGGLFEEARGYLKRAIDIDGNNAIARWKLAMAQCQPIYNSEAEMTISRDAFAASLGDLETWFQTHRHPEAYTAVGSNQPFFLAYQPFNNKDLLSRYGRLCVQWMASMPSCTPAPDVNQHVPSAASTAGGRMRIGIASAHIREHSVWNALTKGWIRHLDRQRFEVHLFQLGGSSDEETSRARAEVAHFVDQPKDLPAWVQAISGAGLAALIYPEIGMDPLTTQLASLRLAPVQAAAWGHPETTGLPTMDLYLSAEGLEPFDTERNYSERLVCLPNLGVCVEPLSPSFARPDLQSLGLPANEPLLLCPGTPFK